MSRLDEAISDTAYILDCLIELQNIYKVGCCNDCKNKKVCRYAPEFGQMVRYNCPFYRREEEE